MASSDQGTSIWRRKKCIAGTVPLFSAPRFILSFVSIFLPGPRSQLGHQHQSFGKWNTSHQKHEISSSPFGPAVDDDFRKKNNTRDGKAVNLWQRRSTGLPIKDGQTGGFASAARDPVIYGDHQVLAWLHSYGPITQNRHSYSPPLPLHGHLPRPCRLLHQSIGNRQTVDLYLGPCVTETAGRLGPAGQWGVSG